MQPKSVAVQFIVATDIAKAKHISHSFSYLRYGNGVRNDFKARCRVLCLRGRSSSQAVTVPENIAPIACPVGVAIACVIPLHDSE
jgi:hypothetical protein